MPPRLRSSLRPAIRLGRLDDIDALADVERSAARLFRGTPLVRFVEGPSLSPQRLAEGVAQELLWIAETEAGALAGFLLAEPMRQDLFVVELSVAEAYQRQGRGRALLRAVIEGARHRRCGAVLLTTDCALPFSRGLYDSEGFAAIPKDETGPELRAKLAAEIAHGHDPARRIAMRKPLAPA